MRAFALIAGFILLQWAYTNAEHNCGKLTIDQMYNQNAETGPDEFPWFGRIYYNSSLDGTTVHRCNAVLISDRHLLTPAHCTRVSEDDPMVSVTLGHCADTDFCSSASVAYPIEKVFIHPDYQKRSRKNDIAVIQLSKSVVLSNNVQAICLPDATFTNENIPEYLVYSGFMNKRYHKEIKNDKLKMIAHIWDHKTCMQKLAKFNVAVSDDHICASYPSNYTYLSGSAIMGVKTVDNVPHNYYLVGMVNAGVEANNQNIVDLFVPTAKFLTWIKSVINA